jgi:DinB family protein
MATRDEVARQPLEQRRARLALTPDELAAGIHGQPEAVLARRPEATSWAAKEIICHLRDTEEMFLLRLEAIAAVDEPLIAAAGMGARMLALKPDGQPAAPDRWAEDRQYLRNGAAEALATFRRLREGTLAHVASLSPEQWQRGGLHPRRGRLTVEDFVTDMAWHDDNHLAQLRRALAGIA